MLTVAYDGTDFHGFARQEGLRTVQGTLESTLKRVLGHPVEVHGSGRTDAGVHARGQVVHWQQDHGPSAERYPYLLRTYLPSDIVAVAAVTAAPDFHARFSAVRKTYRYVIRRAAVEDVFTNRYAWHVPGRLDLDAVQKAALQLCGEHDFTSFCAASTPIDDKRRRLYQLDVRMDDGYLTIECTGNGFLRHMVRIVVGTLVDVGRGRLQADAMPAILAAHDRKRAGITAPPHGLSLWHVEYGS